MIDAEAQGKESSAPSPRNQALNWLARRDHSVLEIRTKLAAREHSSDAIEAAVQGLLRDGLLSDARFAESFTAARVRKGQGPVRIRGELRQRGIAPELIAAQLEGGAIDWAAVAAGVRQRRFGTAIPADFRARAQQMRFLEYRGFTSGQIQSALGAGMD